MKNIIILLVLLGAFTILVAQQPNSKKNMWASKDSALSAYNFEKYLFYFPKWFTNQSRNPADGIRKTTAPLLKDAVVEMEVKGGRRFVILPKHTMLRWENGIPYAHDACGNKIFSFEYLNSEAKEEKEQVVPLSQLASYIKTLNFKGEKGDPGPPGRNGINGENSESSSWGFWDYVKVIGISAGTAFLIDFLYHAIFDKDEQKPGPAVATGPAGPGVTTFSRQLINFSVHLSLQ